MATRRFTTKQKTVGAASLSALLIGTGVLILINQPEKETFETPSGDVVNMEAALDEAETAHRAFTQTTGRAVHDDSACFAVKTGLYLEGLFACGPVRENSSLYGSYDSVAVTYSLNESGEVEATVGESFEGGYTSTPGSILIRPDGLGVLPASLMDYEIDMSIPEIPADAISEDGTLITGDVTGTTIQAPITAAAGETLTLGNRSVYISEAGNSSTVVLDGIEYRATPGNIFTVIKTIPTEVMDPTDPSTGVDDPEDPSTQPGTDPTSPGPTTPAPGDEEPTEQPTAPGGSTETPGNTPGAPAVPGAGGGSITVGGQPVAMVPTTRVEAGAGGTSETTIVVMVPARQGTVGVQIVDEDGSELAWTDLRDPASLYGSHVSAGMIRGQNSVQTPIVLSGVQTGDSDLSYESRNSGYRVWKERGVKKLRLDIEGENWRYIDRGSSFGEVPGAGASDWTGSTLEIDGVPVDSAPTFEHYESTGTDGDYDNDSVKSTVTRSLTWTLPDGAGREYVIAPSVKISTQIFDYLSNYDGEGYGSGSYGDMNAPLKGIQPYEYQVPSSSLGRIIINSTLGTVVPTVEPAEEAW